MLFCHLNIRSLVSKLDELQVIIQGCKGLVLGISETWLNEGVSDAEVKIQGFRMYRRDRGTRGGGVLAYVTEDIISMRRHDLEVTDIEALWIEVRMRRKRILICNIYRPPNAQSTWMDSLGVMIERAVLEKIPVFLMGDLNCDMLNPSSNALRLERVMSEYGLLQMINCPTRITDNSASLIDLFFTSDSGLVGDVGCEEFGLSDHGMIFGVLDIKVVRKRGLMRMIRCFRKCDQEALIGDFKSAPWQVMESMTDIGDRWEYWKQLFWEIVDSHIPLKRARVRNKCLPWITHGVRALMRARSYFSTKAKKSRKVEDWEKYKKVRNLVTQRIRKAKIQFFEELSEQSKGNPKKAWREVNRLLGSTCKHGINSIRTDSHVLTERQDIADEFGRYFSSI